MAKLDIDLNGVEAEMGGGPLPEGQYMVRIVESEWKTTKSGTGQYMEFNLEVCQGPQMGRKLFTRLNLKNLNETAVEMSKKELKCIETALGVHGAKDTQQYHNIPMKVDVACKPYKKNDGTDGISNEIKGYHSRNAATASEQAPQDAPAGARDDSAPWG